MVNRLLLTISFIILSKLSVQAQAPFSKPVVIGLKTGISGSFFTKDVDFFNPVNPAYNSSFERFFRISAFAGITADYMVTDRFSIGAEVLYDTRGMAYRQKNNEVLVVGTHGREQAYNYFKYDIDYMELPLTASYNVLSPSSDNWLTGYIGLAPAIAVNKKIILDNAEANAGPWKGNPDQDGVLKNVRSFNSDILAGMQFGGNYSTFGPFIDLRANYTLLPVFNSIKNTATGDLKTKMLTFTIGFGVKF